MRSRSRGTLSLVGLMPYAASLIAFVLAVLEFGSMFVPGAHNSLSSSITCGMLFVLTLAFAVGGRRARVWSSSI